MSVGMIVIDCPAMLTTRVSWWERKTSEITCPTYIRLPDSRILWDDVVFPVCSIRKKFGLLWLVDEVTATGKIVEVTLKPEWTFGSLALPCNASGRLLDRAGIVEMRFPFAWASWSGPKQWTVEAVQASGTVTLP